MGKVIRCRCSFGSGWVWSRMSGPWNEFLEVVKINMSAPPPLGVIPDYCKCAADKLYLALFTKFMHSHYKWHLESLCNHLHVHAGKQQHVYMRALHACMHAGRHTFFSMHRWCLWMMVGVYTTMQTSTSMHADCTMLHSTSLTCMQYQQCTVWSPTVYQASVLQLHTLGLLADLLFLVGGPAQGCRKQTTTPIN
jgi:hypothetical protein